MDVKRIDEALKIFEKALDGSGFRVAEYDGMKVFPMYSSNGGLLASLKIILELKAAA